MPSVIVYHGSPKQFEQFRTPKTHYQKQLGFGIHGSVDRAFAAKYGRYLYKLRFTYTRAIDMTELAVAGTPEFDMAISIQRRTGRSRMAEVFIEKGMAPIGLDGPLPGTALKLVKQYGFDAVKYNAVVTKGMHRVDDAPSWVVLEPDQVEVLEVVDQGVGVKKEYNPANPYAYAAYGTEVLDWGFISPTGRVVTYTGPDKIDHAELASRKLNSEVTELVNDEGYTRFIVKRNRGSFGVPGDVWGMFLFGAYDMRPVSAMTKYLKAKGVVMNVVQIVAVDYNLDTINEVQGTLKEALEWLGEYRVPEDGEGEEREENPLALPPRSKAWANDSKAQVLVEMDPAHFLDLTTNSYSHRQGIIADAQALDAYNKYVETGESIIPPFLVIELTRGNSDWAQVRSHEGRHRVAALINNGESVMPVYIRLRRDYDDPYKLSWKDVPDTIMGQYEHPDSRWAKMSKSRFRVVEDDRLARFRRENPAPKRPGDKDLRWPFKLKQVGPHGDVFVAEMADLSRYNVVQHRDGTWRWAPENTSRWSETFNTLEGALLNLETEAEAHTGRLGGTMKFIVYSPTGTILGTVTAPNRRAARDVMRGSLKALRFKTPQDGFLQPYISSSPEAKYVADQGVQIR